MNLGNGENRAFIYDRTGTQRLLELASATRVEWPRVLSAVGRAVVDISAESCTSDHDKIGTWANSLVIYRDGDRVWEGPVRRIKSNRAGGISLTASDVCGWCDRRAVTGRSVFGSPVRDEMQATVVDAISLDDPNILAYLQLLGGDNRGPGVTRDVITGSAYAGSELASLVGNGGRFTTLGRSIMLWAESTVIGRTATLVPERHLLTDVDIIEDGDLLATVTVARDDQGNLAIAAPVSGLQDPYYGRVDLIASSGAVASVQAYADSMLAQAYPAPVSIDIPNDAALSCDAPFPIAHLVPGTLVPVETTTATGRTVSATFTLGSMKVVQEAGKDERVTITLNQLSRAVG